MVNPAVDSPVASPSESEPANPRYSVSERALLRLVQLLRALPFSVRSFLGYALGFVFGLLPSRESRIARLQLRVCLGRVPPFLVARTFANAGRTLLESLNLAPLLRKADRNFTATQWSEAERWVADQRPLVALTGHTGNWDLLAAYTIHRGIPLTTVGREARNRAAQEVLRKVREGYGIETIWRSDRSGVKRLLVCMKERRTVAALIDQDTTVESIHVPFFGELAQTPSALIGLGQKCNARFVSAFMFRTGIFRFETFIEEFDSSATADEILTEYNRRLELLIRRFPNQWVWFHKRWRSRPGGEKLSTRQYLRWLEERLQRHN